MKLSHPSSVDVENGGAILPLPHTSSRHEALLGPGYVYLDLLSKLSGQ
jgi:hypothetical protein